MTFKLWFHSQNSFLTTDTSSTGTLPLLSILPIAGTCGIFHPCLVFFLSFLESQKHTTYCRACFFTIISGQALKIGKYIILINRFFLFNTCNWYVFWIVFKTNKKHALIYYNDEIGMFSSVQPINYPIKLWYMFWVVLVTYLFWF